VGQRKKLWREVIRQEPEAAGILLRKRGEGEIKILLAPRNPDLVYPVYTMEREPERLEPRRSKHPYR